MTIGVRTPIGARPNRITLDVADPPVSDGEGGYTQTYTPLNPPELWAQVTQATQAALERIAGLNGTIIASATHVARAPFHPAITTQVRIGWIDRAGRGHLGNVTGVSDAPDLNETILVIEEIVP